MTGGEPPQADYPTYKVNLFFSSLPNNMLVLKIKLVMNRPVRTLTPLTLYPKNDKIKLSMFIWGLIWKRKKRASALK